MTHLRPLGNRVVVRPEREDVTKGGILLITPKATLRGTVVGVGPGTYDQSGKFTPTTVKVGDTVAYIKQAEHNQVNVTGEKLVVMIEDQIIAILRQVDSQD